MTRCRLLLLLAASALSLGACATRNGPGGPVAAAPAVPLPVAATPLPAIQGDAGRSAVILVAAAPPAAVRMPPASEQTNAAELAASAAQGWLSAERILEAGSNQEKRGLYGTLCDTGDPSACAMAAVLQRATN